MAATSRHAGLSLFPVTTTNTQTTSKTNDNDTAAIKSIFPLYDPDVTLDRQEYYPRQASPTTIPPTAVSRPLYSPPPEGSLSRSPVPTGPSQAPETPSVSTNEELKALWKVANGWRAPPAEGRSYAMALATATDAPVYALSSASGRPFYNMTLHPTSATTHAVLSRCPTGSKGWQDVLATTLEPPRRRRPPGDGLVALLCPKAATRLAADRPGDEAAANRADHECARLVWDGDAKEYFVSHAALALPFRASVDRRPAWSRTVYTLEHDESPHHVARLTRHAAGHGVVEIDTAVASRIDAVFFVDVAVAALLLVAHVDAEDHGPESFEPPPVVGAPSPGLGIEGGEPAKRSRMAMFDVEMASQSSELGKRLNAEAEDDKKMPLVVRGVVKLLTVTFKSLIWMATMAFSAMAFVVAGCARCLSPRLGNS